MNDFLTLAIETSCDETSVALLRGDREILVNLIASQIEAHQLFGGVVPEIASRKHLELLAPLLETARHEGGFEWRDLGLIAVTHGPGLAGALLVGVSAAKALAWANDLPIVPVNHIEGHVCSNFLASPELEFPLLALVVSGGHSDLILMRGFGHYERLGRTRDDAVGEAFDKVARTLGLPLPGGPSLETLAREGDPKAFRFGVSLFENFDVSFSGLKTAGAQAMRREGANAADVAASFQAAAVAQLHSATRRALEAFPETRTLGICGGVAANSAIRHSMQNLAADKGVAFSAPPSFLCTDYAAMIAAAGYFRHVKLGQRNAPDFEAHSVLPIA
jgi:N6-L-threonylcarbamoyladenine synthase